MTPPPNGGYTAENYLALVQAIATGAQTVSYGGQSVTYRSLHEMQALRRQMAIALGYEKPVRRTFGIYSKDTQKDQ